MTDPDVMEISVAALDALRREKEGYVILDIREPQEIAICAFSESLNIPMNDLPGRLDDLPEEGLLVVICHLGMRSAQVVDWLRQNSVENAVSLRGGIDAWSREIDPAVPLY